MKQIKHIYQPPNRGICGQCCIAMATDTPIEVVCSIMQKFQGKRNGTTISDVYRCFAYLGWAVDDDLRYEPKKYAIIQFHHHWALKVDDIVYDSSLGIYWFKDIHKHKVRKVRFLELPEKMFL